MHGSANVTIFVSLFLLFSWSRRILQLFRARFALLGEGRKDGAGKCERGLGGGGKKKKKKQNLQVVAAFWLYILMHSVYWEIGITLMTDFSNTARP